MKNCAFQYATSDGVIKEDTGLISRSEADALFDSYLDVFMDDIDSGKEPEMAIWHNIKSEGDYGEMAKHYHYSEFEVRDSQLFHVVRVR